MASGKHEIEIKFCVTDPLDLQKALPVLGFSLQTPRTHEINDLFDFDDQRLRRSGQVLRIRKYGIHWLLTHKSKGESGRHKNRIETEIPLEDGEKLKSIFLQIGLKPSFRYEKFRTEWTESEGYLLLDETPIGIFAELEGPPDWIDCTAEKIGISADDYIIENYAALFEQWRKRNHSEARNMTWEEVGQK